MTPGEQLLQFVFSGVMVVSDQPAYSSSLPPCALNFLRSGSTASTKPTFLLMSGMSRSRSNVFQS